jgi:hypothetical protein
LKAGDKLKLPLPGGATVEATPDETQSFEGKGIVWHGVIEGKKFSDVTFSTVGNAVIGTIAFDGHMYRLRTVSDELTIVEELNPDEFPTDAPTDPKPAGRRILNRLHYRALPAAMIASPSPHSARMTTPIKSMYSCSTRIGLSVC